MSVKDILLRRFSILGSESSIDPNKYLTIEAIDSGVNVQFSKDLLQYCIPEDGIWFDLHANTNAHISIYAGKCLSFRINPKYQKDIKPNSEEGIGTFTITNGRCRVKGNCCSLISGGNTTLDLSDSKFDYAFIKLFKNCPYIINIDDNFFNFTKIGYWCFKETFANCTGLTTLPSIKATSIDKQGCSCMFSGCVSLTSTAPMINVTELEENSCYAMYSGCTKLTTIQTLNTSNTQLGVNCYGNMFAACSSLKTGPTLPSTKLAENCYSYMFQACKGLTSVQSLPATTLATNCYGGMFAGCTSLTTAPILSAATTLANNCYSGMFNGCTSLTTAPSLNITNLKEGCYQQMFSGCTSLKTAPTLSATTLAPSCYESMFAGCTSLTTAPELPAIKLTDRCYCGMFRGCSKLNKIIMLTTDSYNSTFTACTESWVTGVAGYGNFYYNNDRTDTIQYSVNGVPSGWATSPHNVDYNTEYFTIVSTEDSNQVSFTKAITYSLNGGAWSSLSAGGSLTINKNGKIKFKSTTAPSTSDATGIGRFSATKKYKVQGNAMSLLYGDSFSGQTDLSGKANSFRNLFSGSTTLVNAENLILPATKVGSLSYQGMFRGCTSLTTPPKKLPATTLADNCYGNMFLNCSSLTVAPSLPATTLISQCYAGMFQGCSSLKESPILSATTTVQYCYYQMFSGCTSLNKITMLAKNKASNSLTNWVSGVSSTGTFYKNSGVTTSTLGTGVSGIPSGWTVVNYT